MKLRGSLKIAFITSSISKKHSAKVLIKQRLLADVAIRHAVTLRAITITA